MSDKIRYIIDLLRSIGRYTIWKTLARFSRGELRTDDCVVIGVSLFSGRHRPTVACIVNLKLLSVANIRMMLATARIIVIIIINNRNYLFVKNQKIRRYIERVPNQAKYLNPQRIVLKIA